LRLRGANPSDPRAWFTRFTNCCSSLEIPGLTGQRYVYGDCAQFVLLGGGVPPGGGGEGGGGDGGEGLVEVVVGVVVVEVVVVEVVVVEVEVVDVGEPAVGGTTSHE
jgi:hypothetical protein